MREPIDQYLRQRVEEPSGVSAARDGLVELLRRCAQRRQALSAPASAPKPNG
jgi:hypothetical protein